MKNLKTIIALTAIAFAFAACNSCNQSSKQSESKTVRIGSILPLTGGAAFVGVPIKNAISLKVNEFNKTSSTKVEVVFEDSKADVKEAVSAIEKLNSVGIKIILGPVTSGEVLAVAPVAEKNRIIIFSPSASAQNITNSGDFVFRNELSDELGATIQAQLAFSNLKWKKISILFTDNDYGVGVKNAFESEFMKLGGEIPNSISFKGGSTDFKTQILKLKSIKNDAIFVVAQAEYPVIIKQFTENKVEAKVYATPVFEDPSFIEQIGKKNAEGIIYTYYGSFSLTSSSEHVTDFISEYKAAYQSDPSYYAALGFDNICIMIEALTRSNFDINKVKSNLYLIHNFKGVTGDISFDKNGDVSKPVILKIVRDGNFTNYN